MEKNIAEFISITNSTRGAAIRCLEKNGGDLEQAVSDFFSNDNQNDGVLQKDGGGGKVSSRPRQRSAGGVASLSDLRHGGGSHDDEGNDYYVGGHKSGQIVQGGPRDGAAGLRNVEDVFEKAKEAGAEVGASHHQEERGSQAFRGRGHTLSGIAVHDEESSQDGKQVINVVFYENGVFVVDDGEPRQMDDPKNAAFMMAIMNGQCPPELLPEDPSTHIDINLHRRQGDYEPPVGPKYTAFAGTGHSLKSEPQPDAGAVDTEETPEALSWEGPDESKPVTSIQIRLADGSRLVAKFNLDQTVGDLRTFVKISRPSLGTFTLLTSFPTKTLDDAAQTIQDAGLAGSVIIQK